MNRSRPRVSRRRLLGLAGGLLASGGTLSLAACGGGGNSDPQSDADAPVEGGITAAGGPLSDDERFAAFALVSARRRALRDSLDDASFVQQLARYMATLPAYTETGFDAETVVAWGRKTDGRAHIVIGDPSLGQGLMARTATLAASRAKIQSTELPGASKARVLHAFGSHFPGQEPVQQIGAMLTSAGWSVRPGAEGEASLATLRAISGDGFFYINTHGGNWGHIERDLVWPLNRVLTNDSPKMYAITSSTRVTRSTETDAQTQEDLAAWRLVYMDADMGESDASGTRITSELVYGVTAGFIQKYWRFPPHAMVIINACSSARNDSAWSRGFYSEALLAGCDTYFGWTKSVSAAGAYSTPVWTVDRLSGANLFEAESPKQRPFPVDETMTDLHRRGLDVDSGKPPATAATFVSIPRSGEASTHILAPTIRTTEVIETLGEIRLYGSFGSDRGSVFVGQVDLSAGIVEWTDERIRVALPTTGAGSNGDVQVVVRDLKSNVRSVSQWTVPLAFQTRNGQTDGNQRVAGNGALRFRADLGAYREHCGAAPTRPVATAVCSPDSWLSLDAAGSRTGPLDCVSTWSGRINFTGTPLAGRPVPQAAITSYLKIDTATSSARLALRLGVLPGPVFLDRGCGTNDFLVNFGDLDGDEEFVVPGSVAAGAELRVVVPAVRTTVSSSSGLAAGHIGPDEDGNRTDWGAAAALPPPPTDRAI